MTMADASPVGSTDPVRIRELDGLSVMEIPADGDFVELRDWLRASLPAMLDTVGGRACRLDLGTRPIQLFDLRRLVNLLRDDFNIDVTGVYVSGTEVWEYAERELKLRLFDNSAASEPTAHVTESDALEEEDDVDTVDLEDAPETTLSSVHTVVQTPAPASTPASKSERRIPGPRIETPKHDPLDELLGREAGGTRVHHVHRTLRSGTAIRFDGDVLVFGDVNPGAEIIATGNVLVLGSLRGMVHAGASGDENAIILGFDLRPTQLRVGRKIAIAPNEDAASGTGPTIARVRDGKIVLDPYRTRSTR
jgi:septum site-determining protein MinC